jgi:hypothetical protein
VYVFGDGVVWEIVDKNIVHSYLIFLNKGWMQKNEHETNVCVFVELIQ